MSEWKKGQSGNPKGRPAGTGTVSKMNQDLRNLINNWLLEEFPDVQKHYKLLSPRDRIQFYAHILKIALPSRTMIDMEVTTHNETNEDYSRLSLTEFATFKLLTSKIKYEEDGTANFKKLNDEEIETLSNLYKIIAGDEPFAEFQKINEPELKPKLTYTPSEDDPF